MPRVTCAKQDTASNSEYRTPSAHSSLLLGLDGVKELVDGEVLACNGTCNPLFWPVDDHVPELGWHMTPPGQRVVSGGRFEQCPVRGESARAHNWVRRDRSLQGQPHVRDGRQRGGEGGWNKCGCLLWSLDRRGRGVRRKRGRSSRDDLRSVALAALVALAASARVRETVSITITVTNQKQQQENNTLQPTRWNLVKIRSTPFQISCSTFLPFFTHIK